MKFLFDLFPLLLFFAAYRLADIYVATGVAIAASIAQVGFIYFRHRRFETLHLITLGVIVVFGGLTLYLHDDTFIKWKPTLVYWLFSGLILGSQWFGRQSAMEHLLGGQMQLPPAVWRTYNLSWGLFFLILGFVNVYVAFYYRLELDAAARQSLWVNFKVFGLLGITLVFAIVQALFLSRYMGTPPVEKKS